MRRSFVITGAMLAAGSMAGCSVEQRAGNSASADINAAAAAAQGDIDTYAASTLQPSEAERSASYRSPEPAAAETPAATAGGVAEVDDDAARSADVVQRYYALIKAKKYDEAFALWDNDGKASGMRPAQFAESFARYAQYRAEVGTPRRVEAGAGQRHVTVPVRITGTLREDGKPFAMTGAVTLHRTAPIDGATAEQLSWRISAASVRSRDGVEEVAGGPIKAADHRCAGETRVSERSEEGREAAAGGDATSKIWRKDESGESFGKGGAPASCAAAP